MNAMTQQVGGTHYTDMPIQPMYFCIVNNLNGAYMNVMKYLMRKKDNRIEDLQKGIHTVKFMHDAEHHIPMNRDWAITPRCFMEVNGIPEDSYTWKALSALFSKDFNACVFYIRNIIKEEQKIYG